MNYSTKQQQIYFDAQDEQRSLEDFRTRYGIDIPQTSFYNLKRRFRETGVAVYIVPIDIDSVIEVDAYQYIPQRLHNHPDLVVMNKKVCQMSAGEFTQKYHVAKYALKHLRKFFVEHGYCWFLIPKNTKISVMASMFNNGINKQVLRNFDHIQDLTAEQERQLRKQYRVAGKYNDVDNMVLLDKSYIALGARLCAEILNTPYPTIATAFDRVFRTGTPTFVSLIGDKRSARRRTVQTIDGGFPRDIPVEEILRTIEIGVATILGIKHALFEDAKSYVIEDLLECAGHKKFQYPEWRVAVAKTATKDFLRKYVDVYKNEIIFSEVYDCFDADAHIISGWMPLPQIKEIFIHNILEQIRQENYFWEKNWQSDYAFMEDFLRYGIIAVAQDFSDDQEVEDDFARVRTIIKKNKIAQFYELAQNVEGKRRLNQDILIALIDKLDL